MIKSERCGIILAGGSGTRLHPLTLVTSKQLLPIFDKPMIYYPLAVLMLSGIRDILVITTPEDQPAFRRLLGDGSRWGISLSFAVQPKPEGLAQALIIGADFIAGRPCCLILGDNIIYGQGLPQILQAASSQPSGATIFGYRVQDPRRYGVVEVGPNDEVLSVEEKPAHPRSHWAAIGLYFYDTEASAMARDVRPSSRGELEITDLNELYRRKGQLKLQRLGRGIAWFDAGTHESLLQAGEFIRVLQSRQGQLISAPEEISYHNGWIDRAQMSAIAATLSKTDYGRLLQAFLEDER